MKQFADNLTRKYELENTPAAFYAYIVKSLEVGQRSHCIELFNEMHDHSKLIFLTEYLDTKKAGIELSVQKICISELLKDA